MVEHLGVGVGCDLVRRLNDDLIFLLLSCNLVRVTTESRGISSLEETSRFRLLSMAFRACWRLSSDQCS